MFLPEKVRTVNDPEKWPILPETIKSEEQPETIMTSTGGSLEEKSVNTDTANSTMPEPEPAKVEVIKTDTMKVGPAKSKSPKNGPTKSEGLQSLAVQSRFIKQCSSLYISIYIYFFFRSIFYFSRDYKRK